MKRKALRLKTDKRSAGQRSHDFWVELVYGKQTPLIVFVPAKKESK